MADDPRRTMAGALLLDLEKQQADDPHTLLVSPPDSAGKVYVNGYIDIYLLADAAMEEAAEDQARCDAQAELARRGGPPQTPEQISAFAKRWDARVEAGRERDAARI